MFGRRRAGFSLILVIEAEKLMRHSSGENSEIGAIDAFDVAPGALLVHEHGFVEVRWRIRQGCRLGYRLIAVLTALSLHSCWEGSPTPSQRIWGS
jgi:hypothetical protein